MNTITRWEPFRGLTTLQDQMNRLFEDTLFRGRADESALTTWAPAVDIYETENALVVKADLPDVHEKDLDIQVENNIRVERAYGSFSRSFTLGNTVNTEAIKAEYRDGVLTLTIPKREEAKPKQVKVSVAAAGK